MDNKIKVLGFSGSIRKRSYNSALLRNAFELKPDNMELEIFDLSSIPLYDDDIRESGYPESVMYFREKIANADALLIATPEYNYSIPGVLKNAIDWASRPPDQPFDGKPVAIMGASGGISGTIRAQIHLRDICVCVNMIPLNKPQLYIQKAREQFDEAGNLINESSRNQLKKLLAALADWTYLIKGIPQNTKNLSMV
jgi:chromate reductase, NAD(P)H dehydrogenase (quinone)